MAGRGTGHIKWGFVFSFTWWCGGGEGAGLLLGHWVGGRGDHLPRNFPGELGLVEDRRQMWLPAHSGGPQRMENVQSSHGEPAGCWELHSPKPSRSLFSRSSAGSACSEQIYGLMGGGARRSGEGVPALGGQRQKGSC